MRQSVKIAFFGSSLVSAYWNGAATYYRGMIKALDGLGHKTTFFEPDAYDRQRHRDMEDPEWAQVVVYKGEGDEGVTDSLRKAREADIIIKASGVGVFDELLEEAVPCVKRPGSISIFWDVDAPATLERVKKNPEDPFRAMIPAYDMILTYGGGPPVVNEYKSLGAKECVPIYNALDPSTHHPAVPQARFKSDLAFIGNRLPDREERVKEFFFEAARMMPERRFLLGGNGWEAPGLSNVDYIGHVYTKDHNAINSSPLAVLNVNRDSMARYGFSPPTRIFEAAGAGACIISDWWKGIDMFLEPGREALVAKTGAEVAENLRTLDPMTAAKIGRAAFARVISCHTYSHRARQLEEVLGLRTEKRRTG